MSSDLSISRTTVLASLAAVSAGVVGYCIYFDWKRRNDPEFRKAIRREHKRLAGLEKEKQRQAEQGEEEATLEALRLARSAPLPTSAEEREQQFMTEVARGEQLYAGGEPHKFDAAICFWRALKMYPQPAELTRIYEQTIPPFVFKVVQKMVELEDAERAESLNEVVE
ncbi:mitochondrial import receptor subunit tom20 [Savitreella phatthalungensis]